MEESEETRVREVQKFLQLDFNKTSEFQDIVDLAAQLCDKPVALITLLDKESNWLKVRSGVDIEVMPRETSFCQHGIQQNGLFIIPDATKDARFANNPLVSSDPNLRFYAGVPLTLNNGLKLGTLCLFDVKPNNITHVQQKTLTILARQATFLMELEMSRKELQQQIEEKDAKNEALMKIAQLQSHQIRQPLTTIMALVNLVKEGYQAVDEDWLSMFETATKDFDARIHAIVAESMASKDLRAIRFNKMVEEIDDYAILLLDKNGNIENWNKGAEKIKGYRSEEIVGKHFSNFYTDYDKENGRPAQLIKEAEEMGAARDEGWRLRKDGSRFWGRIVITAIHNDHEEVIGFTKVTRDLTDIRDTRDALVASESLYKFMVQQTDKVARVGGWELDLENNMLSWTSVTRAIHGVGADYIPELNSAINFYKEGYSRDKILAAVNAATDHGDPWDLELQIVNTQGKELWVRTIGQSNYKDGICTRVYGAFQDIDAIKKEEIDISRSRKLFKDILDAVSGISIIVTDVNGMISIFNSGAEKLLGYKADEIIDKQNLILFHPIDELMQMGHELSKELGFPIEGFTILSQSAKAQGLEQRVWTYLTKDGSKIPVSLKFTVLRDHSDAISGYMCIATEII